MRSLAAAGFAVVIVACNTSPPTPPVVVPSATSAAAPPSVAASSAQTAAPDVGVTPTPYTAEQIRAACPAGRTITFRREVKGAPLAFHVMRFVTVDADGADVESRDEDEAGRVTKGPERERSSWEDLRKHAEFPRAATTIEDGSADTPAGRFAAKVYAVKKGAETTRFYFAIDRAGPPVLFTTDVNGERVMTSTLVPDRPPPVACKTDDDCWVEGGKPVARPKALRGKKFKPCQDGERAPVCGDAGVCVLRGYKC